eukprot:scaffold46953_cov62-Phaeocystis_antarctica.AAC.9
MPPSGGSALHLAAASGDVYAVRLPLAALVRLLLSAGSPVHARARNGSTYAAHGSNPRLADPTQSATYTFEPRLGQAAALGGGRRARGGRARAAAIRRT